MAFLSILCGLIIKKEHNYGFLCLCSHLETEPDTGLSPGESNHSLTVRFFLNFLTVATKPRSNTEIGQMAPVSNQVNKLVTDAIGCIVINRGSNPIKGCFPAVRGHEREQYSGQLRVLTVLEDHWRECWYSRVSIGAWMLEEPRMPWLDQLGSMVQWNTLEISWGVWLGLQNLKTLYIKPFSPLNILKVFMQGSGKSAWSVSSFGPYLRLGQWLKLEGGIVTIFNRIDRWVIPLQYSLPGKRRIP